MWHNRNEFASVSKEYVTVRYIRSYGNLRAQFPLLNSQRLDICVSTAFLYTLYTTTVYVEAVIKMMT